MSALPDPTRREAVPHTITHPELDPRDAVSVVVAEGQRVGSGVAELWFGSVFLGILHEERGGIVLRLESHASGPITVSAVALERALTEARARLTGAVAAGSGRVPS